MYRNPAILTRLALLVPLGLVTGAPAAAQEAVSVEIVPGAVSLAVGEEVTLTARVLDAEGNAVDAQVLFFPSFADGRSGSARQSIDVDRATGRIRAVKGGEFLISAIVATARNLRGEAMVSVAFPPVDRIDVTPLGGSTYVGVATRHRATLLDTAEDERDGEIRWSTSDGGVATVDRFGILTAHAPGSVVLRAEAEGISADVAYEIRENPAARLTDEILWRQKEQFSDGVGYSWIDSLKEMAEGEIGDGQLARAAARFPTNTPLTKEAYLYRSIFASHFPGEPAVRCAPEGPSIACSTPAAIAWDPAFAGMADPSGRAVQGVHAHSY